MILLLQAKIIPASRSPWALAGKDHHQQYTSTFLSGGQRYTRDLSAAAAQSQMTKTRLID